MNRSGCGCAAGRIIRTEAVDDTSFFQVVRCHFNLDVVSGENTHLVDAHASGKMAKQLMTLCFQRRDTNAERRIWVTLFYDADEFNYVFRHKEYT